MALPDSGADVCVMGKTSADSFGMGPQKLQRSGVVAIAADGLPMDILGEFIAEVQFQRRKEQVLFLVSSECQHDIILSWAASVALGIIQYHPDISPLASQPTLQRTRWDDRVTVQTIRQPTPHQVETMKQQLMDEYHDVFSRSQDDVLPPQNCPPLTIELQNNATPTGRTGMRKIPLAYRDLVKGKIDKLDGMHLIEKVTTPTEWCHPLVVVPKKNGDVRICVDFTALNKFVKRPNYPVRTPKEAVSQIPPGMKYFTTMDAAHGYWQIELSAEARDLTTFMTPMGKIQVFALSHGPHFYWGLLQYAH